MLSKKSLIYIRLYNSILTNKKVKKVCVDKIRDWEILGDDEGYVHNPYIIQELAILRLIEDKVNCKQDKHKCRECIDKLVRNEYKYLSSNLKNKIKDVNLFDHEDEKIKFESWINKMILKVIFAEDHNLRL